MPNPLVTRFTSWLAKRAVKAAGGQLNLIPAWKRYAFSLFDFSTLVTEAYKGNATVFACQLILALKFPEPSLQAWKQNVKGKLEIIPNHPLRLLLSKPNPDMGEDELMKYAITYCALGGNIYLWKQREVSRKVKYLWPFHDGQVTPVPGRNTEEGLVHYYVLDVGAYDQPNPWQLDRHDTLTGVAIPKSEIIHWKWMLDPDNPARGIGALVASAGDINLKNELKNFVYSLLKNDATPPFIITLAEGEILDQDKTDRLGTQWLQAHGGYKRGLPAFLEAGMKTQQLGLNLQQLNIENLQSAPDVAICMGYHIHPGVVGTLVGLQYNTYANASEARQALTEDTLIPLWRSFASEFQQSMADEPGYGKELVIEFEISTVRSLQTNQSELETRLAHGVEIGALTRAQYLQGLGYETTPADEVRKVSLSWDWERANMTPEEREAIALGAGAEPGQAGGVAPANLESLAGLNGAQIEAALSILEGLRTGVTKPVVATELLIALGLDPARVARMVAATSRAEGDEPVSSETTEPPDETPFSKNGHSTNSKGHKSISPQQRAKLKKQVDALRKVRTALQGKMETALQKYFDGLAGKVEGRLEAGKGIGVVMSETGWEKVGEFLMKKPKVNALLTPSDEAELETLLKSFSLQIGESSWGILNVILGVETEFDRNSPAMQAALARSGDHVKEILDTTKEALRELLKYGQAQGWSIQDYVNGDETMRGISAIVEETYKNRAEAVARTELGNSQGMVAQERYKAFGIEHVIIFDNGFPNSHPFCTEVDGQTVTLAWYENNTLQHPNCVRAAAPLFDFTGDVFTREVPFGGKFDGG